MNASNNQTGVGTWGAIWARGSVGLLWLTLAAGDAAAASIHATARDVADVVPGVDRWELEYIVSGHNFGVGEGFTIYFNSADFANLEVPALPAHPGWDLLLIQPETVPVGLDGLHDGMAVVANPSLVDPFVVRLDWLGTGRPGIQLFEIYVSDPFSILEEGQTVVTYAPPDPGVPDGGGTKLLLGTGMAMLFAWARWTRGIRTRVGSAQG